MNIQVEDMARFESIVVADPNLILEKISDEILYETGKEIRPHN